MDLEGRGIPGGYVLSEQFREADEAQSRALGFEALRLYYDTAESKEGGNAFREKRKPEFRKFVK